jgi:hypothetical protein
LRFYLSHCNCCLPLHSDDSSSISPLHSLLLAFFMMTASFRDYFSLALFYFTIFLLAFFHSFRCAQVRMEGKLLLLLCTISFLVASSFLSVSVVHSLLEDEIALIKSGDVTTTTTMMLIINFECRDDLQLL